MSEFTAPVATFAFEPIDLDGGWSGRVLTDFRLPDGVASASSAVVRADDWRGHLEKLVCDPQALPGFRVLKRSRTAEVVAAKIPLRGRELEVVCKRSRAGRGIDQWVSMLRGSQVSLSWSRALGLLRAGICTALPRVLIERRSPAPEAWMVTDAVTDAIDLDGVMGWHFYSMPPDAQRRLKNALIGELAGLCAKMRRHHVFHRDFKASNILVTEWEFPPHQPSLWLIDLDGVRVPARRSGRGTWRAIVRLAASLADQPSLTRSDCSRFLRSYLRMIHASDGQWRSWWRRLAPHVTRYNALARGRKVGKIDGFEG